MRQAGCAHPCREAEGRPAPAGTDRELLRRQVRIAAAGASGQREFFARLRADGLLVRQRMSERDPGEVTAYAVALPDRYGTGAPPVYFGGSSPAGGAILVRGRGLASTIGAAAISLALPAP